MANPDEVAASRPVLLRGGTVLTMDDAHTVRTDADVLVTGDRIAAVGPRLQAPEGALEIDASGGIVMPGMIDTHRHMWQTAMRAYGADWTLTQFFVWNYLEHGRKFRPEDIHAGNLISAWEALEAGVTTTVDWSHNLHTPDHAEAAVDALRAVPGRFVLAYGNIQAGPWEWTADPAFRSFFSQHPADDMLGFQIAFDVTGDPAFPEKAAFEVARELGLPVTTRAGVWGANSDDGVRLMHVKGETVTHHALRAEHVVDWATRGGARTLGRDDLGRLEPGAKADVVLIKNDSSPVSFPLLNPYGHVVFQAQRGDVHTVLVDGRIVKHENRLVRADLGAVRRTAEATVDYRRSALGEEAWAAGMNPDLPTTEVLDNPYQYTEFKSDSTHGARGSLFGEG